MAKPRHFKTWLLVGGLGASGIGIAALFGMSTWVGRSARGRIYERARKAPPCPVAIVPGAKVWSPGHPSAALRDRLHTALELFRAGLVQRILVSGDHGDHANDETNTMRTWLVERGVPSDMVFMDHAGFRTLDTMARATMVFEVHNAVICTQRFHLPRAIFLARSHGIDAVGVVADRRTYSRAAAFSRREFFARISAFLDVHLLATKPRYLGPKIPIWGAAKQTHDHRTSP